MKEGVVSSMNGRIGRGSGLAGLLKAAADFIVGMRWRRVGVVRGIPRRGRCWSH